MFDEQLKYKVGITLIEGIGDMRAKKLIAYCGGAEAVFKEKKSALQKIPDIGKALAEVVVAQDVLSQAEEEIEFIEKNSITPLFYLDKGYPIRLKHCDDSPVMLYAKGNMNLNAEKVVSIVGTRNATNYGKKICEKLVEELARHNVLIISGLAYGIDILSHKAALKNNLQTVAVLGHGLDKIYPQQHRSTSAKMLGNGGLVTDFLPNTKPDRENFPKRNRIVAGLADAVIVIESAASGGSLITAEIANSYNRDVFAVPGKIGDNYSEGCNWLIKINKAALLESAKDIQYLMGWEKQGKKSVQKKLFVDLNSEEELLVKLLKQNGEIPIDRICLQTDMPMSKTSSVLLKLEFKGVVRSLPGKVYALN
ncbi:DNA-processing protein DprA [Bacteroidales bacterium AH-315-I05]|nr:DNA-processing protein DprA [Bacteroidales bacterium AH-315-I05]